jgi:hypothetical protein
MILGVNVEVVYSDFCYMANPRLFREEMSKLGRI